VTSESTKLRAAHRIVVLELSSSVQNSRAANGSVHVISTSKDPEEYLTQARDDFAKSKIRERPIRLRQDLVSNYKPSRRRLTVERRLAETRQRLDALGYVVTPRWYVYVLDVDPDNPTPIADRGKKNHVVYVGQTSKEIETRLKEHRGEAFGKGGRYLGSRRTKGRSPTVNKPLTPKKKFFSQLDAEKYEVEYSHKLEKAGYRVLGDGLTDPAKRKRST